MKKTPRGIVAPQIGWRAVYVNPETRAIATLPVAIWVLTNFQDNDKQWDIALGHVAGPGGHILAEAEHVCDEHIGLFVGYAAPGQDSEAFRDDADVIADGLFEDCGEAACKVHAT